MQEVFSGDFQARTDSFDGLYAERTSPTGCGPVVQRGVFGLKIGRNGTNYREPAFQIVGINAGSHIAADDVASKKPTCPCD